MIELGKEASSAISSSTPIVQSEDIAMPNDVPAGNGPVLAFTSAPAQVGQLHTPSGKEQS